MTLADRPRTRRWLIAEAPRLALAGAIAAATGALAARGRSGRPVQEQPCINAACRGCGVLRTCRLPRALSTRAAGVRS